jgi:hypothetical protein
MGRYDFDFGYNIVPTDAVPEYQPCMGAVVCMACNKHHGYCSELTTAATDRGSGQNDQGANDMDLSKQVSGKKRNDFEKRDWIAPEDLPTKGSSKWKVDGTRDAKKNKTGILVYIDLTRGKIKRVMSLRKNFTLDMFVEALGANTDKWAGKTIDLERGGNEGQYVNVSG